MSLKAFHIVFVVASILLGLLVGTWGLVRYFGYSGGTMELTLGVGGMVSAVALTFYARSVIKKLRHISYL